MNNEAIKDYDDLFDIDRNRQFYTWTIKSLTPDKKNILLSPILIQYNDEYAKLSIDRTSSPIKVTLEPKEGYKLDSYNTKYTYDENTKELGGLDLDNYNDGEIDLADVYRSTTIGKPIIKSVKGNTVTLESVDGCEYSKDDGATWQDSAIFDGLKEKENYSFVQRKKADVDSVAGLKGEILTYTHEKSEEDNKPNEDSKPENTESNKPVESTESNKQTDNNLINTKSVQTPTMENISTNSTAKTEKSTNESVKTGDDFSKVSINLLLFFIGSFYFGYVVTKKNRIS